MKGPALSGHRRMMNVALTIWEDRISPVFDAGHDLMIVVVENREVREKRFFSFDPDRVAALIGMLRHDRVDALVCGAISEAPARMIVENGIQLIPFISGNVDRILETLVQGKSLTPVFLMPGCGRRNGRCERRGPCRRAINEKVSGQQAARGQGHRGPSSKDGHSVTPEATGNENPAAGEKHIIIKR